MIDWKATWIQRQRNTFSTRTVRIVRCKDLTCYICFLLFTARLAMLGKESRNVCSYVFWNKGAERIDLFTEVPAFVCIYWWILYVSFYASIDNQPFPSLASMIHANMKFSWKCTPLYYHTPLSNRLPCLMPPYKQVPCQLLPPIQTPLKIILLSWKTHPWAVTAPYSFTHQISQEKRTFTPWLILRRGADTSHI